MPSFKFKKYVASSKNEKYTSAWRKLTENKFYRVLFGGIAGAILGLLYWNFIGCRGGNCALTSNPYKTMIMFTFMGIILARKKKGEGGCC